MARLNDYIREKRNEAGLSQAKLATRLGMTQDNYNKLETGKRGFSDAVLQRLAKELCLDYKTLKANSLIDKVGAEILEEACKLLKKQPGK